jgi:hypothetical protein
MSRIRTNKLITMFRRGRPVHQVPQALRELDLSMLIIVNEQQEAATLAKARETLIANPGQPSPTASVSTSRSRPTVARKRSILPSAGVFAGAVALFGIFMLIVWYSSDVVWLTFLPLFIMLKIILSMYDRALARSFRRVAKLCDICAQKSRRTDRQHEVVE